MLNLKVEQQRSMPMSKIVNQIKNLFIKDIGLKILAILLAVVTFYGIQREISFEISYDIPLEIDVKSGVAVLDKETESIHVSFRGAPEDLGKLDQKLLKIKVKPHTDSVSGTQVIDINTRNIDGARGVTIASIKPSSVMVTFDHEVQKSVFIEKPTIQGSPLLGRAELEFSPKIATVSGSHKRLSDLKSVTTEPVDVDGRVESFNKTIRILIPGGKGNIKVAPQEVQVKVNIITEIVSITMTNVPVLSITEPGKYSAAQFSPPEVNVILKGNSEILDKLDFSKVRVFANCLNLDIESTNAIPLTVHLPINKDIVTIIEPNSVILTKNNDDIL